MLNPRCFHCFSIPFYVGFYSLFHIQNLLIGGIEEITLKAIEKNALQFLFKEEKAICPQSICPTAQPVPMSYEWEILLCLFWGSMDFPGVMQSDYERKWTGTEAESWEQALQILPGRQL